jgi:acetyl-CoA carboxylase biotin carboxyl carrier protein
VPFDANELKEILLTLNQTDITELNLKQGDFELLVRRGTPAGPAQVMMPAEMMQFQAPMTMPSMSMPQAVPVPSVAAAPIGPSTSSPPVEKKYLEVTSPIVGTFYASPSPDDPPFVQVGERIKKSQTVCIIEAMKIMNEIEAEVTGEIIEILVQNGQPVEYGQPLMRVNPG